MDTSIDVVVLDNLKRRGSELNLPEFKKRSIPFFHGDVRQPSDLEDLPGQFDLVIDASAEPSVLAGIHESPNYVLDTNLKGTLHCLEFARKRAGAFLFLSTSRVYSIEPLKKIQLRETETRFEIADQNNTPGFSTQGVDEAFPTHLPRSFYGASKLSSEMLAQEYADTYKLPVIINRCGVISGPGQFGKVDQGVFSMWVFNHLFGKPLKYQGFGGNGKQVRDLLHPADLFSLIRKEIDKTETWKGQIFNIGGGRDTSLSLMELTQLCQELTGKEVPITKNMETAHVDIPLYISNSTKAKEVLGWEPKIRAKQIILEILAWAEQNRKQLELLL
jgi:CDP-paratose 2-epimerase